MDSAAGSESLFSILPPCISLPLGGLLLLTVVVFVSRPKKSGQLTDSGVELIAPAAWVNRDDHYFFDDNQMHYAWNHSASDRYVLVLDFESDLLYESHS